MEMNLELVRNTWIKNKGNRRKLIRYFHEAGESKCSIKVAGVLVFDFVERNKLELWYIDEVREKEKAEKHYRISVWVYYHQNVPFHPYHVVSTEELKLKKEQTKVHLPHQHKQ